MNREWVAPWLDRLMVTFSSLNFWIPWLVLLFVAVAVFGGFKARALLVALALTVGLTDGLVVKTLKKSVGRPRPSQVVEGARIVTFNLKIKPQTLAVFYPLKVKTVKFKKEQEERPRGGSFPSSHTANNFACATVLTFFYRRRGWLMVFPAALVGYSRIYTASHWPSDVLAGSLLGIALGCVSVAILSALWRHLGAKVAPQLFAKYPDLLNS